MMLILMLTQPGLKLIFSHFLASADILIFDAENLTDPRHVEYLLRSHGYRSWVIGSATGTTVKHTVKNINNIAAVINPADIL